MSLTHNTIRHLLWVFNTLPLLSSLEYIHARWAYTNQFRTVHCLQSFFLQVIHKFIIRHSFWKFWQGSRCLGWIYWYTKGLVVNILLELTWLSSTKPITDPNLGLILNVLQGNIIICCIAWLYSYCNSHACSPLALNTPWCTENLLCRK